jgi:hypothetical protein
MANTFFNSNNGLNTDDNTGSHSPQDEQPPFALNTTMEERSAATDPAPAAEGASNGYRRYSMGESGTESDTTVLQSNQHVKRTNSYTKNGKVSSSSSSKKTSGGGHDQDRIVFQVEDYDEGDDLVMDFNSEAYDLRQQHQPLASKGPMPSYKKSAKAKKPTQPKRHGDYGRISHDSFHSGYSEGRSRDDDGK